MFFISCVVDNTFCTDLYHFLLIWTMLCAHLSYFGLIGTIFFLIWTIIFGLFEQFFCSLKKYVSCFHLFCFWCVLLFVYVLYFNMCFLRHLICFLMICLLEQFFVLICSVGNGICFVLICSVGNVICFVLICSVGNGIYVLFWYVPLGMGYVLFW